MWNILRRFPPARLSAFLWSVCLYRGVVNAADNPPCVCAALLSWTGKSTPQEASSAARVQPWATWRPLTPAPTPGLCCSRSPVRSSDTAASSSKSTFRAADDDGGEEDRSAEQTTTSGFDASKPPPLRPVLFPLTGPNLFAALCRMYWRPATHPRRLMMPDLRCCTCHGCRPAATAHRNPLSKTPPARLVSFLSFPDVCERSTLLGPELLRAAKAFSRSTLHALCSHRKKTFPNSNFLLRLFLILEPIPYHTRKSSSSVPPKISISAFSRSPLPSWTRWMSENQKKSTLWFQMFHCMRPKFIWNFNASVNIPEDAGHRNACRKRLRAVRFRSDWFTLVGARFNTKEAFGSCGVNTVVTVWFCAFFTVQDRKKLQLSTCSVCITFKKKKKKKGFDCLTPIFYWLLPISKTVFKDSFFFFFQQFSPDWDIIRRVFFFSFSPTTEIHTLTQWDKD